MTRASHVHMKLNEKKYFSVFFGAHVKWPTLFCFQFVWIQHTGCVVQVASYFQGWCGVQRERRRGGWGSGGWGLTMLNTGRLVTDVGRWEDGLNVRGRVRSHDWPQYLPQQLSKRICFLVSCSSTFQANKDEQIPKIPCFQLQYCTARSKRTADYVIQVQWAARLNTGTPPSDGMSILRWVWQF